MKRYPLFFCLIFITTGWCKEILIITPVFNKPQFIGWQKQLFDKFVQDKEGYRFVAYDDSNTPTMTKQMKAECKKWKVQYIRVPQDIHTNHYVPRDPKWNQKSASFRHSDVIQYIVDTMAFDYNGIVFLTDSDLFLVRPINFHELMQSCDIYTQLFEAAPGVKYMWPGLAIMNMERLPNKRSMKFHCGRINNAIVDTGGFTYHYFKNNPSVRVQSSPCYCGYQLFLPNRYAQHQAPNLPVEEQVRSLQELGFDDLEIRFLQRKVPDISWTLQHCFLHYNAASNYDNTQSPDYIQKKDALMKQFIDEKLAS